MRIAYSKRADLPFSFSPRIKTVFLIPITLIIGCGRGSAPTESPEAAHIGKVGQLATDFKATNSGNNPKNLDELKNWAIKTGKGDDTDFVSTRDHEPYVLEAQAMSRGGGTTAMKAGPMTTKGPLIIHEATGKNGRKFVVQGVAPLGSEMSDEGLQYLTHGPTSAMRK
jgi:hypothetical protein